MDGAAALESRLGGFSPMPASNLFADAIARVEPIGEKAGIDPEVIDSLRRPEACLIASLTVRMDDGSTEYFAGYRCRYNDARGPAKDPD